MASPPEPPQRIAFLLGAGASIDADVPGTVTFVAEFENQLRRRRWIWRAQGLRLLRKLCRQISAWSGLPGNPGKQLDVESLLDALAIYREGPSNIRSVFTSSKGRPGPEEVATATDLEIALKDFIRDRCFVESVQTAYLRPLLRLISDERPLEVFTVNYDLVIEQFLVAHSRTFTDGFQLGWAPQLFDEPEFDVRLYKLHGSATWFSTPFGDVVKLPVRDIFRESTLFTGENVDALMLYPTQKFLYTATFLELFRRFQTALTQSTWLIAVGYTFRDEQIVRSVTEASKLNPNLHVILVGPECSDIYERQLRSIPMSPERQLFSRGHSTIPSPLEGRVARLPFYYKDALPVLFTEILPLLRDARLLETGAQKAEVYGPTSQWREAARRYNRAGFVDKAREFERSKFRINDQDELWRLGYLFERSVVEISHAEVVPARESWRAGVRLARTLVVDRCQLEFGFQGSEIRIRFYYGATLTPDGRVQSGYQPDAIGKVLDEVLVVVHRAQKLVNRADRRRQLDSAVRFLEQLYSEAVSPARPSGDISYEAYLSARPQPVRQKVAEVHDEMLTIAPPNFNEQTYRVLAARLTSIETQYLRSRVFRKWRFD